MLGSLLVLFLLGVEFVCTFCLDGFGFVRLACFRRALWRASMPQRSRSDLVEATVVARCAREELEALQSAVAGERADVAARLEKATEAAAAAAAAESEAEARAAEAESEVQRLKSQLLKHREAAAKDIAALK